MSAERPHVIRAREIGRQIDWWLDGPILNPLRRMLAALFVAAGPWLIAVAALIFISRAMAGRIDFFRLEDLRLTIVYAFMIAPLAAAPIGVLASRVVLTSGAAAPPIGALMIVTCGLSGGIATLLALLVSALLRLDGMVLPGFVLLTSASAMMWTMFPLLAALGQRRRLIIVFGLGMALTAVLTSLVAPRTQTGLEIVWCFVVGTVVSLALSALPHRGDSLSPEAWSLARDRLHDAVRKAWPLATGALCLILGTWADKWIYWLGPEHLTSAAGFVHFPPYDSLMFFAHLSVVPALAALATFQEGPVSRAMRHLRDGIDQGDTLPGLRGRVDTLRVLVWDGLARIFAAQIVLSAGLILVAAVLAPGVGLQLDQYLLLRVGLLAAVLHALFLAASSVLAIANARRAFAATQILFMGLNIVISLLSYGLFGVSALGLALASAGAAVIALPLAAKSLSNLLRLTFLDENEALD